MQVGSNKKGNNLNDYKKSFQLEWNPGFALQVRASCFNTNGALLYLIPMYVSKHPGCSGIRDVLRRCGSGERRDTVFCLFTHFSLETEEECIRKNVLGTRRRKLPTVRPGEFEFYRVWDEIPTRRFSEMSGHFHCLRVYYSLQNKLL